MKIFFAILFFLTISQFPQELLILESNNTPSNDSILLFKPSEFYSDNMYPLLILLHGWSGNYKQWSEITDLQAIADQYGFVIACPDGFYDSWYIDSPIRKNYNLNSFIVKDLIPYLTMHYQIETKEIFISGLSMGGFGAIYTFLTNSQLFRSAAGTSGVLNILTFAENWGMKSSIGTIKTDEEMYLKFNTISILDTITNFNKPFLIDCGTEDRIHVTNNEFYNKCLNKKIPLTYISQPGKHDKVYWAKSIIQHMQFFRNILNNSK